MREPFGLASAAADALLDLLWPTPCALCERDVARGEHDAVVARGRALYHGACLAALRRRDPVEAMPRPWPGPVPLAAWLHDGPELFRLLHRAKYGGEPALLVGLARAWAAECPPPDPGARGILVPLPDDAERRRKRGFGVTLELARALSRRWGWSVREDLLRRRAGGTPQAQQPDDASRRRNVRSRFAVGRLGEVERRVPLVLVEDQVTTGATLQAALASLGARGNPLATVALAASARAPRGVGP